MKNIFIIICLLIAQNVFGQNTIKAIIKNEKTKEPLQRATAYIEKLKLSTTSNEKGEIYFTNIPDGIIEIEFSYVGFEKTKKQFNFSFKKIYEIKIIELEPESSELEEVVVSVTRSSRTIDNIPTRIETISASELEEKISMQPSNVKMVLTESTGIQTQQTSASSANASIRIQGLDGKYTQLLKDGFPLYSGFSGGLSIVQIPPLDLKRVEVIKGASSTLYGGGAIAGLINFVTKEPTEKKELSFLVNTNNTKAFDFSGYYSQKFKKIGITLFASQNLQTAYDANNDGLSDIPKFTRYNFNPRIFFYIHKTVTLSFGVNSSFENRLGGDMILINNKADLTHTYFEKNLTKRISTQLRFDKTFSDKSILTFKNSFGYFDRNITQSNFQFAGEQISSFSELTYLLSKDKSEWIFGGNVWTDNFKQTNKSNYLLDNNFVIGGVFIQNNYKANEKLIIETGIRADVTNQNSNFVLPRISAVYKFTNKFSARIGGGLGYKLPTIFTEDAEENAFKNIQPLNFQKVKPEKSIGVNFDFNYRTSLFDKITFSINQMFFYTRLNQPLTLSNTILTNGNYEFENENGFLESKGFETNIKLRYKDVGFYCGYTFIDANRHFNKIKLINPLTAKSRIYLTLNYEFEEKLRIGYECFYTGLQHLSNGQTRPDYWVMGISVEYRFKHISLFLNTENFTDTRQTRYETIYTGTLQNPLFKEIWAPTDGFIYNGGFKINIW